MSLNPVSQTVIQTPIVDQQSGLPSRIMQIWLKGVGRATNAVAAGLSFTAPLAKITGGGADGSITFTNGIATAYTPPT